MINRQNFSIKAYLVVGPENTLGRDPLDIIRQAIEAGFSFIQVRSKEASARELIDLTCRTAQIIEDMGAEDRVALVVNDRLDVVLAARDRGAKVDGIHVGQSDIPVEVCRNHLGPDALVGLSADTQDLMTYVKTENVEDIDYFGAGPLRFTPTKPNCGYDREGTFHERSFGEIEELEKISQLPLVIGGGVKLADIPGLKKTGVAGFFVVSAVAGAEDPYQAAKDLVAAWEEN
ncbi:MAG: thiamine phosphate synthase [Tissierellia bacterium]|nr:thiamine phosphate synthase [Tissierellia bacterium]